MHQPLTTSRTSVSPLFPTTPENQPHQPSLYIPHVPQNVFLQEILSQVGDIESIDWVEPQQAYVHFSMWYDTPLAEKLYATIMDDDDDDASSSYRLYDTDNKKYIICRRNRHPVPRYRGPFSREYFIAAIDAFEKYGVLDVKRKHIRFDDEDDLETEAELDDYYVDVSSPTLAADTNKNIHQLAAEYEWWLKTSLQITDHPQQQQ
jgi:hypothetical protein